MPCKAMQSGGHGCIVKTTQSGGHWVPCKSQAVWRAGCIVKSLIYIT